jgi:hypothetical protein
MTEFSKRIINKPKWDDVSWAYNTKNDYQSKQDLTVVFWNPYIYLEQKIEGYYRDVQEFPISDVNDLIFEFRQHFPVGGRMEGVNYFDDLLEQLAQKYQTIDASQDGVKGADIDIDFDDLNYMSEQVRLLVDLGIVEHLQGKYPSALRTTNSVANLLDTLLRSKRSSIQPCLNAMLTDNFTSKSYPKESVRVKSVLKELKLAEED